MMQHFTIFSGIYPRDGSSDTHAVSRRMEISDSFQANASANGLQFSGVSQNYQPAQNNHFRNKSIHTDRPSQINGADPYAAETNTLRNRVKELERKLDEKDMEISRLRAQVSEYRAREQASKDSSSPNTMMSSQGSQTYPINHTSGR